MSKSVHCPFCGSVIESESQFCQSCGASLTAVEEVIPSKKTQTDVKVSSEIYQQPTTLYVPQEQEKEDSLGILSLISGILGLFLLLFFAIGAIITGHIARRKTKSSKGLIGLILGYAGLAIALGVVLWMASRFW